jgi:hypothetical protein
VKGFNWGDLFWLIGICFVVGCLTFYWTLTEVFRLKRPRIVVECDHDDDDDDDDEDDEDDNERGV